MQATVGEVTT